MPRQFFLDAMVGKLATYLRMCGYDTRYAGEEDLEADAAIGERVQASGRTLVTRDRDLAASTDGAILLTDREIKGQLAELRDQGVDINLPSEPERCSVCNGRVDAIESGQRPEHAPDGVRIWQCRDCEQYFWKGSHWERMAETVATRSI
ncbi:MAG: hypothetical protein J07HN4v3_00494 [Halonotius sp. J07HN4]|nr:MAG: hypothetical protein J07HN4v3_00494 [Halonotius sp. J07HN4]